MVQYKQEYKSYFGNPGCPTTFFSQQHAELFSHEENGRYFTANKAQTASTHDFQIRGSLLIEQSPPSIVALFYFKSCYQMGKKFMLFNSAELRSKTSEVCFDQKCTICDIDSLLALESLTRGKTRSFGILRLNKVRYFVSL